MPIVVVDNYSGSYPGSRGETVPRPQSNYLGGAAWTNRNLTVTGPFLRLTAMKSDPYLLESPYPTVAGESIPLTVTYDQATSVSSPVVTAYKNRADVTSTLFPTNSPTASGNVVTLSALTGMVGGNTYVIALSATVDGATIIRKLVVMCSLASSE
jgi:hypothetical protein